MNLKHFDTHLICEPILVSTTPISVQVIPQFLLCLHEGWFKCNHMG
jgi:hypothetical protein